MKNSVSVLYLLFCFYSVLGQVDYRVIGVAKAIDTTLPGDFYIEAVEDQRTFQANLGVVNRGQDKVLKRALIEEAGFLNAILEQLNDWIKPEKHASPVIMQIRELYLWEYSDDSGSKGFIRLEVGFLEKGESQPKIIAVEMSDEQVEVAKGHAPRLERAFFESLNKYQSIRSSSAVEVRQSVAAQPEESPQMAFLMNFLDLREGYFQEAPSSANIKRIGKPGLFRYRLKKKGEQPYYGIIKNNQLYIKASNFPGGGDDYYLRVLEKGRYLFLVDQVYIKPESEATVKLPQPLAKVGILIDMENGIPRIIDDHVINELLEAYPDLQEHYMFKDILRFPFQLSRIQKVIAEINQIESQHTTSFLQFE
jgi:hypothetical protein